MNSEDKNQATQDDQLDQKMVLKDYDPFSRNTQSESELQEAERIKNEQNPQEQPEIPGSPNKEYPINPQPETPVIEKIPELPHEQGNLKEIQIPPIPNKQSFGDSSLLSNQHKNKNTYSGVSTSDSIVKEFPPIVYPSIINPENIDEVQNDAEENWIGINKDLESNEDQIF